MKPYWRKWAAPTIRRAIILFQYNEMPLRVEYSLTLKGQDLLPVFYAIMQWGIKYIP